MTHLTALERNPSTFGAGSPLAPIRPFRRKVGNIVVNPPPEWIEVIDTICVKHKLHRKDILAGWKSPEAVACRFEIWRTIYERFDVSLNKLGMMTGGYHHTTVLYALRRAAQQ